MVLLPPGKPALAEGAPVEEIGTPRGII